MHIWVGWVGPMVFTHKQKGMTIGILMDMYVCGTPRIRAGVMHVAMGPLLVIGTLARFHSVRESWYP